MSYLIGAPGIRFLTLGLLLIFLILNGREIAQATDAAAATLMGKDGAPMALIPEGTFHMGVPHAARDGGVDERPNHEVFVDSFYMDLYEVTNGRYLQFVTETGHRVPQHPTDANLGLWKGTMMPESVTDLPVINVDWFDADAYCHWAGKRLPTEAEWEKAAKGDNDWRFAWGDVEPTTEHANFNQLHWRGEATLVQVGIYEKGKSPYGIYDVAGNVWEWVSDWYEVDYYQKSPPRNPQGPETGTYKAVRSSGWQGETPQMRVFTRIKSLPNDRNNSTGFRCAKGVATSIAP
ncbi:MAG: formylglycine-generating enzyme family protein [Nitrospirota bacterium]|nr:formylglycine-generating enzyme family protein [Nitrospirota bacterium]MDH5586272.1 formylglycine-generating enzyme family protein [Nitrospirota bacterium]MDH5775135.1 formylglycine-generating enzyme family protein [Nitrospirota bacterium]